MATALSSTAPAQHFNTATRTVVSTLGVLLGVSSINHGVLEILQGNQPIHHHIIKALGPGYHWTVWTQGSEPAFTVVPSFLTTGILATIAGLLIILCSLRFIHKPHGPMVFLLLSIASFLVGGGLAQVLLFTVNWAFATRILASLGFWRVLLPRIVPRILVRLWPWTLTAGSFVFLAALEIATFGYIPGVAPETQLLHAILLWLGLAIIIFFLASFILGLAHDIEAR